MIAAALRSILRFRLLVVGLGAGVLALGIISLPKMPSDVLPELANGPVLEIQTEALGLSSQEVEQYLTVPLENNLLDGVMGVWDVRSQSVPGLSTIDMYFEPGTTVLHARQLVEERLTNSFSLPAVSKPPLLIQPLSSSSRVLMIGLSSTTVDPLDLSYLARWVVKPRLAGVSGVANVAIFGQQDRQLQVQVNPATLAAQHVTLQQVIETAGNAQLVSPLSYLQGSSPGTGGFLDEPNQRLEIRPVLPLGAPNDLASVPVTGASAGLTLGKVANVVEGHQPLIGDALGSQGSQLVLLIQKLPSASVVGVTNGVERALQDLSPALQGVKIDASFFRPAAYVTNSLDNLALGLAVAAALGLIALGALFLGLRAVAISALSVALSVVLALLVLQTLGYTLNALVVLGLLVSAGVLVDDAVGGTSEVVANLRRRRESGEAVPIEAVVLETCSALRGTLGYATLIVLLVVVPVFFADGLTATYLHPLVLAFALAVLASALVALTFTPALTLLLFFRMPLRPPRAGPLSALQAAYARVLRGALAIPRIPLALACVVGLAGYIVLPFLHEPAPSTFKDRSLVVQWNGPSGASLGEMNRLTLRVVQALRALPSVGDAAATLGRAVSADQIVDTNSGQIYVSIRPSANYGQAVNAVRSVVESVPGMQASVSTYEGDVQAGVLEPASHDLTVRLYGEDYGQLRSLAAQLQSQMSSVYGLGQPQVQLPVEQPSIQVNINGTAAHDAGVLPGDARRQASTLVSGLTVGNFFENQAVFDVVVVGTPAVRDSVDSVRNLLIDTSSGGQVPLSRVANVAVSSDPVDIEHDALSRYVDVTVPVYAGGMGAATAAVQRKLANINFPLTYHAQIVGPTPNTPTSHLKFLTLVLAATIGLLLLLQAALRSWRLAALLMLLLPLSLAGGLVVAVATGQAASLASDAALLGVFAFAARQALLQVAHTRRRHTAAGGKLSDEIVLSSAGDRFSSSLTSALVLAAVLVPFVVMGDVAGNELTHTAAAVMLGGLVSSILVTQLLVPAMCLALGPTEPAAVEADGAVIEADHLPTPSPSTS
jgi:Cu/Ag efflux pump CusA